MWLHRDSIVSEVVLLWGFCVCFTGSRVLRLYGFGESGLGEFTALMRNLVS